MICFKKCQQKFSFLLVLFDFIKGVKKKTSNKERIGRGKCPLFYYPASVTADVFFEVAKWKQY